MRVWNSAVAAALGTAVATTMACSHAKSAPTPAAPPRPAAAAPATTPPATSAPVTRQAPPPDAPPGTRPPGGEAGGGRAGGPGGPRVRRPPNFAAQDSTRKALVAEVLKSIAGRENEPATKVFKNVKVLTKLSAAELLTEMDVDFGRGLGWTCSNCHTVGQFDLDTKKDKVIARKMKQMSDVINATQLPKITELDEDYKPTTCVSCHKGANHIDNKMEQPKNPPAAPPGK